MINYVDSVLESRYDMFSEYGIKKKYLDKMYKYTEWVEIWKWIKEQSPAD